MRLTTALLAVGSAARLTRVVVTDDIGQWWIKDPIDRVMDTYAARARLTHGDEAAEPWWWKYRSGLDCPWCVGFWVSLAVAAAAHRPSLPVRLGMAGLTINYVASHLGSRLGDYDDPEDTDA